jgi:putative hydrolase of the HAD superfamily
MTWLLCDYGEVLSLPQSPEDLAGIEKVAGRHGDRFWADYWAHRPAYDLADISVADYWSAVLGQRVEPDQLRRLIELDAASWLHPNALSLEAAGRANARGLRLAILSNAPVEVAAAIDAAEWLQSFAPRLFSCRLRTAKPEPAAFGAALDALKAKPEEVLFFDDRAANVAAARRQGIRSYLFENPLQFDRVSA